jgi:hypothetical protein
MKELDTFYSIPIRYFWQCIRNGEYYTGNSNMPYEAPWENWHISQIITIEPPSNIVFKARYGDDTYCNCELKNNILDFKCNRVVGLSVIQQLMRDDKIENIFK